MSLDQQTLDAWVQAYPGLQDLYPATGMQLGLVFHSLLHEHEEDAYAIQLQMDFDTGFDGGAFRRAWDALLQRHAIFRTAFVGLDRDQPMQVVVKNARLEWREEDWRALTCEAQEEAFARLLARDRKEGFDFGRAPLMRMSLLRLSEHRHRWLWTHHHSVLDGWSLAIVTRELFEIYAQLLERRKIALPRPPAYRDYIAWLCALDPSEAENYWRDALLGVNPTRLGLPERLGEAPNQTPAQEEQQLVISAQRASSLQLLVQRQRVTLNSVIQGAWAYLLHRYSGEREVVFGQTVSGRSAEVAGIEAMVGLFINTLPIRVEIREDEDVGEWLRGLHAEQGKRESHGSLPLVDIQKLTGLQAGETLFDTLLVFENYPLGEQVKEAGNGGPRPAFQISGLEAHEATTGYDLALIVVPRQELTLRLLYQRTRYSREIIAALLGHLDAILDGFVNARVYRVQDLPCPKIVGGDRMPREEQVEIERALLRHEGVSEAVVMALEARDAQRRWAAYVVERTPGAMPAERFIGQLKAHLRAQPKFCPLPQEWRVLDSLPRTAAGTVDRSALPRPEKAEPKYVAPRTQLEKTLVELWQEQLGIERVGLDDNYFALGGDSIRSIGLVALARKRGVEFSIKDLFVHPTVSDLASALERGEVRGDVVVEQEIEPFALLTQTERERLSSRHDARAIDDAYPLSMMQQGMVLESLRHADLGIYLNIHLYEFKDAWDRPLFERALSHMVARHSMLRTVHDLSAERPLQLVLKDSVPALTVVDVRDLEETAIQAAFRQWMQKESARPLEMSSSPWRLTVHVVSERSFTFGMVVHHAQWDGWSLESFAAELYAAYGLLRKEGRVAESPPLPSYKQFIALEQAALSSEAHRSYWTQKLEGATVPWWTGREKSASVLIGCEISQQTGELLAELARRLKVQEKSVWCSVYLALLSVLSGTDEAVGTVMTQGRPEIPGGDKLIGVFLNALPIRVGMSGRRWTDLIVQTDRELREQHAFRHYPLAEIQRLTQLDHSASMFNYTSWQAHREERDLGIAELSPRRISGWHETNYLLNVFVHKDGNTQRCYMGIHADTQVFDAEFRERIRGYVAKIVRAIASDATGMIEKAALLGDAERHRQLIEWNATEQPYPRDKCIHELFEVQARQREDAVALVYEGGELTYGELNRCANGLAHELIGRGVGPEVCVGLCMERSAEMMIGLLGILKAGGCYVPLDPGYPQERLEFMLNDAAAALLLVQPSLRERIPASYRGELVELADFEALEQQAAETPGRRAMGDNLAYVIYTSGSTGRPKGVGVSRAGIVNRLLWMQSRYEVGSGDRILQKTPTTFDVSVWELFLPLLSGSALVMARPEGHRDPSYLMDVIGRQSITMMHFVPSMLHAFLASESQRVRASCRTLQHVICSGEALSGRLCDELFGAGYAGRLHNLYGPTEASVDVSSYECEPAIAEGVPIGGPIWNTQLHVLDRSFEPVPIGVAGELYIGGVGLARGYLGRAALTAERFVANPYGEAGSRLYRTGDLVRRRSDGALEFIGRADHQVKVRGYRIELGEVEEALRTEVGVSEAVVVASDGKGGDRQLVGYVVRASGAEPSVRELRAGLTKRLPSHMVPSHIVMLEALPLTASGKIDRKALPAPEESASESLYAPPEGLAEELLAGLWCVLLKRERVSRHDNFFELGGHSLLMTQLASRIRESFSTELPVRELFEHPTLSSQARALERARGPGTSIDFPIEAVSRDGPLPLSYAQQRLWFLHQYLGPNAVYTVPLALRLYGDVHEQALVRSLQELHRRHESLRTRFESWDGSAVQVIDSPGLDLEVEGVSAAEVEGIVHAERNHCFDLSSERLCRIRLLREMDSMSGDYVLLVTLHHGVSDAWSLGIFFGELVSLYQAYTAGESSPLASLPIQYADYAQWQRRWLQGAVLEKQVSYWREQLRGLPPLLTLPTDRPRPAEQTFRGSKERFVLSPSLAQQLQALSREQGVTLFMTLLSGFAVLLGRYAGQCDVAVGTPIANRTRRETEGLIGFFVNTLVMRHDLNGDPRFVDLLKRTREMALQAYAHQDVPFEQLVEELNPQRSVSHSPLFQVVFALQNAPFAALELPGLMVQPLLAGAAEEDGEGAPEGTVRFDMTLSMQELPAGLVGVLEYNTDLFERGTIQRMLNHYARLLEVIVAAPQAQLSGLEMLGEEEKRQLLLEWNATACAYPQEKCIHELFEAQAERTPDRIALVQEQRTLTYGELNRRANQLAHCLREQGVGPEVRVGICMERSPELAVGLLGILKTGGAYVPLDPEYPEARLDYMLAQSGCHLVLSEQYLTMDLPLLSATKVLPLDADLHETLFGAYSETNVQVADSGVDPSNLAYVVYTSGSTGQSKGIAVNHRNVSRLIYNDFIDYARARTILCASSPSFDAITFELWGALLHGGCSVMAAATHGSFGELGRLVERHGVDCAFMTTALFNQLIVESADALKKLKCLLVGGEAASIGHFREGLRRLPTTLLSNIYGPTENTTFSSLHTLVEEQLASRSTVPIGRPIGNAQAYVLGARGEMLPVGVAGELYLGGAGLARGYLEQAGLTAEKFVPNCFALTPGERLYRTGDLVRYLPDGDLEFIGRVDHQVKVRGFRIELGEIESELRRHEAVRDAVVVAHHEDSGSKRLVGYVVAESGMEVDDIGLVRALRSRLQERLPSYMVPSALVVLASLPRTANGKVDRQALPASEESAEAEYTPPEGPTEESLAQHWRLLLKRDQVGRHDNFFALGGHSLLALRVSNFVRQEFGVELELPTVFAKPSIAQLAEHISLVLDARGLRGSTRRMDALTEDVEQGSF